MRILLLILATGFAALGVVLFSRPEPVQPTAVPILAEATPIQNPQSQAFILPAVQHPDIPLPPQEGDAPVLDANAAIIYMEATESPLFTKNDTVKAPIASLTKVMTALVVDSLLAPDDIVTVSSASVRVDGDKQTLFEGERILVGDLMTMMLVESSNDAAYALAAHAEARGIDIVAEMNRRARELGMLDSKFTDPSGLDDAAYSTVRDLVRLVRAAQKEPELWAAMRQSEVVIRSLDGTFEHQVENTNQLLGSVPGIAWGKTGYTDGALGCLVLVVELPDKDATLVSIVLGSRARFADTERLFSWASDSWDWN